MNGWKNYQTWNVTLWIQSDPLLFGVADESKDYSEFRQNLRELLDGCKNSELAYETGDGVAWNDSAIDQHELAKFWTDNGFGVPPLECRKLASSIEDFGIPRGGFPTV